MPIAAIYVRVSSAAQVEGRSLEGQVADLQRAAAARDLTVPEDLIFIEEGVSGTHASRPAFDAMLAAARAHRFETLLIWKLSRFARNARNAINTLHDLEALGVSVIFLQDGLDTTNRLSRAVVLPVLAGFAEMESDNIREQALLGKWTGARAGAWVSGFGPFGYRTGGQAHARHLVPDEEPDPAADGRSPAEVVRMIFDWCADEDLGPFQIAQRLNSLGIPPPAAWSRRQKRAAHKTGWEHGTVGKLLAETAYVGQAAFGRYTRVKPTPEIIEARKRRGAARPEEKVKVLAPADRVLRIEVPPLVSPETFATAQRRLARSGPRRSSGAKRLYMLTRGRTLCAVCERPYAGTATGANSYMICTGSLARVPKEDRCQTSPRLRTDEVEARVWAKVLELLDDDNGQLWSIVTEGLPRSAAGSSEVADRVAAAEATLADLDEQMANIVAAIRRGSLPVDVTDQVARDIALQRTAARQELRRLQAADSGEDAWQRVLRIFKEVTGVQGALRDASPEVRDHWIGALSTQVLVQPDGALDVRFVLPLTEEDRDAALDANWRESAAETWGEAVGTEVPPTGFEPVLPP